MQGARPELSSLCQVSILSSLFIATAAAAKKFCHLPKVSHSRTISEQSRTTFSIHENV